MSRSMLFQLLPLPDEDLQQVLDYASTLSKDEAASHFTNLLGDSPQAIEFISSFNSRRKGPTPAEPSAPAQSSATSSTNTSNNGAPTTSKRGGSNKKKKAPLHTPEARRVDAGSSVPKGTAYNKNDETFEYMPTSRGAITGAAGISAPVSKQPSRSGTPKITSQPSAAPGPAPSSAKANTTAAGYLISEAFAKPKAKSNPGSRSSTPKPSGSGKSSNSTKINLTGGTPMIGASAALADLEAAIRALEISSNPATDDPAARRCDCVATRHPLQTAAPNCLSCGKVICVREGFGPCTYCGTPLLSSEEVNVMVRELKEERGRERMAYDAETHRKAPSTKQTGPFSRPREPITTPTLSEAEVQARTHRDKLLNFQAQNAQRTTVHDEASDFDIGRTGGSMWASPVERAKELKRQQKLAREMEWNAKPEWEKRQQVMSIDLVGGKVVKRMAKMERPSSPQDDDGDVPAEDGPLSETSGNRGQGRQRTGGAFSGNPLLGQLIRPVFEVASEEGGKGKGKATAGDDAQVVPSREERKKGWRRVVQDDQDDNEGVILDGGVYGHVDEPEK